MYLPVKLPMSLRTKEWSKSFPSRCVILGGFIGHSILLADRGNERGYRHPQPHIVKLLYTQQLVQIKCDVAVHDRDLYLLKLILGPPKKLQYSTRAEGIAITRLRIGHTYATKSYFLSRGPPTTCHHCGQILNIDHMLLEYAVLQENCDEYYTANTLNTLARLALWNSCEKRNSSFGYDRSHTWLIPELKQVLNIK